MIWSNLGRAVGRGGGLLKRLVRGPCARMVATPVAISVCHPNASFIYPPDPVLAGCLQQIHSMLILQNNGQKAVGSIFQLSTSTSARSTSSEGIRFREITTCYTARSSSTAAAAASSTSPPAELVGADDEDDDLATLGRRACRAASFVARRACANRASLGRVVQL